jgi:hypothetical protein
MRLAAEEPEAGPWHVGPLKDVVESLICPGPGSLPSGRPVVLAVDGRSNNGKTTLAARMAKVVPGSAVIHTDDIAWRHSRFGWADLLIEGVLRPAHRGDGVAYRPPRWIEHGREGQLTVPAGCPLLIVEGVGAGRAEAAPLIDSLVWVQSDAAIADRRGLERVGRPGGPDTVQDLLDWMDEERPFVADEQPWNRADIVVCGTPEIAYDPEREAVVAPPPRTT